MSSYAFRPSNIRRILLKDPSFSSHDRFVLLQKFDDSGLGEQINARGETARRLKQGTMPDGTVRVLVWQRDCDHCTSQYVHVLPDASLLGHTKLYWEVSKGAEGPFTLVILPADQPVPSFKARDYVMEAFEDGHAWSVEG